MAAVEQRDVPIVREWIGQLDGSENVDVRARVHGYIQEIAFQEGTVVKPGDLLLRIDPRPFEAAVAQEDADLAQATATQEKPNSMSNGRASFSNGRSAANRITTTRLRPIWGRKQALRLPRLHLNRPS